MPAYQIYSRLFTAQMASVIYPDIPGIWRFSENFDFVSWTISVKLSIDLWCALFANLKYFRAYIMQKGCACRFLHGPGTDQEKIVQIEKALEAKTELQVEIQFYRKNGIEKILKKIIFRKWNFHAIIYVINVEQSHHSNGETID